MMDTLERLKRAAQFYDGSPTGQYDEIAAEAIRIVLNLMRDLKNSTFNYETHDED